MIYLLFIPVFVMGLCIGQMFCGHDDDAEDALRRQLRGVWRDLRNADGKPVENEHAE